MTLNFNFYSVCFMSIYICNQIWDKTFFTCRCALVVGTSCWHDWPGSPKHFCFYVIDASSEHWGLGTFWHGCSVFSLLRAAPLKLCLCLSWIWKASPVSVRATPFSLAITISNKAVIFELVLVVISRQHLGRCAWYGSTSQLQLLGQLLACWAAQLDPGHGSTASAAQGGAARQSSELGLLESAWSSPIQSWGSVWI